MQALSPIDVARSYLDRGWMPVPVPFRTKRPVISEWQHFAISDDDLPTHFNNTSQNVGVLLGTASNGLVDIDLDCSQAIYLADQFLPATEGVFGRKSKPRSHRLYVVTESVGAVCRFCDVVKDASGKQPALVEYRSTGGQTIFPGSVHEAGEPIEWENDQPYHVDDGAMLLRSVKRLAAASLLARHWPGSGSRHDARLALTGGLIRAGWNEADTAHFVNAVESIQPAQAKDTKKDGQNAAKTSAKRSSDQKTTGFPRLAKLLGDHGHAIVDKVREWLEIVPEIEVPETEPDELPARQFPAHLLSPPGRVGSLVAWINATAIMPQPIFALANALAFWGVVVGRKVAYDRTRTNLYCIGIGDSGCGKEWSRTAIKKVVAATGIDDLLGGEDIASDTGLMKAVERSKSVLFQIDEVGHFFGNLNNKYAGIHQKNIAPAFTKLFSSATVKVIGKEFANGDRIIIDQPNVGLYGTTVPEKLFGGMSPAEVSDGFLARMLMFRTTDMDPEETDAKEFDPPSDLIESIIAWHNRNDLPRAAGNLAAVMNHKPIQVPATPEAEAIFAKIGKLASERKKELRTGSGLDSIWARAPEHVRKLSLVIASGCAFEASELRITGDIAQYASDLTAFVLDDLVASIRDSIAGSDFERDLQAIVKIVKYAGVGGIRHRDLLRSTQRMNPRQRDDALKFLLEIGRLGEREDAKPTRGKTPKLYYLAKF